MTGGEIFVECLKAQGVTDIFGMPGGHLNPVYESLYKSREQISHYVVRHEGGAAFSANVTATNLTVNAGGAAGETLVADNENIGTIGDALKIGPTQLEVIN